MEDSAKGAATQGLFTRQRFLFALLAGSALVTGYVGIWQYVNTARGAGYGQGFWDILYYDLQLFVFDSKPLDGPPPFNPALEVARYLAAATTVYALMLAATALFGETFLRWRRRRTKGHAIVVGDTLEARAIAARRAETLKVLPIDTGGVEELRSVGMQRARVVYACGADREDVVANVATALAAVSFRRRSDLRINVHVTDPTLALGLRARRLMMEAEDEPVIEFFSMEQMAARNYVRSQRLEGLNQPRILIAGASAFGQAAVVEFCRRWQETAPGGTERVQVTLVDENAEAVADQLADRWRVVSEAGEFTAISQPLPQILAPEKPLAPHDWAIFCHENEHLALSTALGAAELWTGGPVVVRLSRLARHGAAFSREHAMLDDLNGRLTVVNVADVAGELVVQDLDPLRDFSVVIHERYRALKADGGAASLPWAELSEDLRAANRAQAHHIPKKLTLIRASIAPRSARQPTFRLNADEIEPLAQQEHERWMAERMSRGWRYGPVRNDKKKIHPDLVPWERLSERSKEFDRSVARGLEDYDAVLGEEGLQIVRLTP